MRFALLLLLLPSILFAQKLPSIEDKTKDFKKISGYIPLYSDESTGKVYLELARFDTEFLYVTSLPAGLGSNDIGLDRGLLGGGRVVKLNRVGRKVLLIQPNFDYRAVTNDNAEKRAVEQSFAQSTLWGFTIEAESNGAVLVDATDFLIRDAMQVANRLRRGQQGSYRLDKTRSAMYWPRTKNFPFNRSRGHDYIHQCRWSNRKLCTKCYAFTRSDHTSITSVICAIAGRRL